MTQHKQFFCGGLIMATGIGYSCAICNREKILDSDGNLHCPDGCVPIIVEIVACSDVQEAERVARIARNAQAQKEHTGIYNDAWDE